MPATWGCQPAPALHICTRTCRCSSLYFPGPLQVDTLCSSCFESYMSRSRGLAGRAAPERLTRLRYLDWRLGPVSDTLETCQTAIDSFTTSFVSVPSCFLRPPSRRHPVADG